MVNEACKTVFTMVTGTWFRVSCCCGFELKAETRVGGPGLPLAEIKFNTFIPAPLSNRATHGL